MSRSLNREQLQKLKQWFLASSGDPSSCLFAVLDAARESSIPTNLSKLGADFVSLYRGEPEESLADVAPYLVKIGQDAGLLDWLVTNGWGQSWGIFLISESDIESVRRHLRHFLIVHDPDSVELYFRFYDPRVLNAFLPTCTASQLKQFFGPVSVYLSESQDGLQILQVSLQSFVTTPLLELSESASFLEMPGGTGLSGKSAINRRLKIRSEQMDALSEDIRRRFEDRLIVHARKFFPDVCGELGDDALRKLVQDGLERAAAHEIVAERDVSKFVDVLLVLGADFDSNPKFPWATEILNDESLHPTTKASRLFESAQTYVQLGAAAHG